MQKLLTTSFWAIALFTWSAQPGRGQTGTSVNGTLRKSDTTDVVAGATVVLEELGREARSGADGAFSMEGVPAGAYHLLVRAEGFVPHRFEVTVQSTALSLEVRLEPELHYSEVVSVSPGGRNQFESYQPATVLAGQELEKARESTIGATLQYEPGLSVRSLGPGPARPVVRGLDGDRVLILEDGQRMGDLSSQSADHGVNANPASASRIEVVRGPATLLYGANAIGGVVNVIRDDVPRAPVTGLHGGFALDAGSAAAEAGGGGDVTVGNGRLALHVSGSGRRSGQYATPEGDVPNSFTRGGFGSVGLAWTGQDGYFGGTVGYDKTTYGVPFVEEGETSLNPRRVRMTLKGERRNLNGFLTSVRGSFGVRRYAHDELEDDEVITHFENDMMEFDFLANHRPTHGLSGSFGVWGMSRGFLTEGAEALSPTVDQRSLAAFVYEEYKFNPHVSIQFGGRVEHANFTPDGLDERSFTNVSGSVGVLVHPTESTSVAFNLARAGRNPALEELYFIGPHPGSFAFENGDPTLDNERALGMDLALRWRGSRASGEVTYFRNAISNFVFRELSGDFDDGLPETFFTAADGVLQGIESHMDFSLHRYAAVEAGVDYVRGQLTQADIPVPRMPPFRFRTSLRLQKDALQGGIDAIFTGKQDRVYSVLGTNGQVGEMPTDAWQMLRLFASYSFINGPVLNTLTLRVDNVGNQLYRNHLNYLKDLVPEMGRNFKLLYSIKF